MPATVAIPLIVAAASAGSTAYGAHQASKASKLAMKPAEQMAALARARETALFGQGMPLVGQASNYWQKLLTGSRAAMRQATAGPAASIRDTYRGAERGLEHSGVRGAARDVASSELGRQKAGQVSSLISGVQPQAASAITDIGTNLLAGSGTALSTGAGLSESLMRGGLARQEMLFNQGQQSGSALGGLLASLLPLLQRSGANSNLFTGFGSGGGGFGGGPAYPPPGYSGTPSV